MAAEDGINAWVGIIANYLSFVSPVLSGLALRGINKVRKELTIRSLLPSLIESLIANNSAIAAALADFDENEADFSNEIVKCRASLRPVAQLKNNAGKDAIKILKLIESYNKPKGSIMFFLSVESRSIADKKRSARKIYEEINGIIEETKRVVMEQRLGA